MTTQGELVIIQPREGVRAAAVIDWLESNFQVPGRDDGRAQDQRVTYRKIVGPNPLINALFAEAYLGQPIKGPTREPF